MVEPRRRPGFSLIELAMVLAVIAIAAAMAAPRYAASAARYRLDSAARRVAADLNLARSLARTSSSGQAVSFQVDLETYVLVGQSDLMGEPGTYSVNLAEAPYRAKLSSVDFGGDAQIVFDGYGRPDSGGQVVVASAGASRTVVLDGETGEAAVQE